MNDRTPQTMQGKGRRRRFAASHEPGTTMRLELRYDVAAWIIAGLALFAVLNLGLLAGLLAGLMVYEVILAIASRHSLIRISYRGAKVIAVILVATVTIVILTSGIAGLHSVLTDKSDNPAALLQKMADIIGSARIQLPPWIQHYLPANVDELETQASDWLRSNVGALQRAGESLGGVLAHILVGMIIGCLVTLGDAPDRQLKPFAQALADRIELLGHAFHRIVFAQIRISALNTALTAIYIVLVLPTLGIDLPLKKTMIVVTFLVGLLPVIGNLISNTVIVIVSLSVSAYAAMGSLGFLIAIHKLEYFVNARIIGTQIRAHAWELLLAMLVMDAWFGIPGVIAAPIYYGYLKDELSHRGLV
jgi:predicted PurR-regulated permease PerM